MPIPGKPEKTQFCWYQYALDEEKFQQRNKIWLNEQVDAEDIEAIGLVNKEQGRALHLGADSLPRRKRDHTGSTD